MPPRSVLLNVFTTARGLGKPVPEESVRKVRGEEENAILNLEGGGDVEGKEKSLHIKHDSVQPCPEDSIAITPTCNSFTTSTAPTPADNISPLTLTGATTNPNELTKPDSLTAPADLALGSKTFKPARTCDNCGYTPATSNVTLKQCSRCKLTLYCSAKCQKSNWPAHKKACSPRTPTVDSTEAQTIDDTQDSRTVQEKYVANTPHIYGASTPASPSEDGTTSTAATSPGLYLEYKTELLNNLSDNNASIPLA